MNSQQEYTVVIPTETGGQRVDVFGEPSLENREGRLDFFSEEGLLVASFPRNGWNRLSMVYPTEIE